MISKSSIQTQCCCCAFCVLAAMTGIFMLSAGICIVINVTFMEVAINGLSSGLQNKQSKRYVGIFLICVASVLFGSSAVVSVLYFSTCKKRTESSRKIPSDQGLSKTTKKTTFIERRRNRKLQVFHTTLSTHQEQSEPEESNANCNTSVLCEREASSVSSTFQGAMGARCILVSCNKVHIISGIDPTDCSTSSSQC